MSPSLIMTYYDLIDYYVLIFSYGLRFSMI